MSGAVPIAGSTRLFAIVGDPVAQVGSPALFNARFAAAALDSVLIPLHVPAAHFDGAMRGILRLGNLDGVVVTIPFKQRILDHVGMVLPTAKEIGAANAIRRDSVHGWVADNFDGAGLVQALAESGQPARGKRVALLGAGGAGMAIAVALAGAGASGVAIFDLDRARAEELAARVRGGHPATAIQAIAGSFGGYEIMINATPVGMRPGDGMPADLGPLDAGMLLVDISVSSGDTLLLRTARAAGCRTLTGRDMLAGQVSAIMRFFGLAA